MISLEDAQSLVLSRCSVLPAVEMSFTDVVGRVLATDIVAAELVPPFDNSAVDGYAVVAADTINAGVTPVEMPVLGEVAAGGYSTRELQPGEAIRIMTGAPMPAGADAVVMVEDTERLGGGSRVRIGAAVSEGSAIRLAGDDVQPGQVVFTAGTEVTPPVAGVLASINARTVSVYPAARVAVLSTGDELVSDGSALQPGQIRESNLTMLAAALAAAGCTVINLGVITDDEAELERVLRGAAEQADAIVTSGGVSMGDYDVVKAVLGRIAAMEWMQIAIKPAKPFAFGVLDGTPVFGLPGNPVSSLVSFEMMARPALRKMMGYRRLTRQRVVAIADEGLDRRSDGRIHLIRVIAAIDEDGRYRVRSIRSQGSHQLAATALANAIAVVPDGGGIPPGAEVAIFLH